jgi:hypothetical protein
LNQNDSPTTPRAGERLIMSAVSVQDYPGHQRKFSSVPAHKGHCARPHSMCALQASSIAPSAGSPLEDHHHCSQRHSAAIVTNAQITAIRKPSRVAMTRSRETSGSKKEGNASSLCPRGVSSGGPRELLSNRGKRIVSHISVHRRVHCELGLPPMRAGEAS